MEIRLFSYYKLKRQYRGNQIYQILRVVGLKNKNKKNKKNKKTKYKRENKNFIFYKNQKCFFEIFLIQ